MSPILLVVIGLVALGVGILVARWFARANPATIAKVLRWTAIAVLFAALLLVIGLVAFGRSFEGRVLPGVVLGGVAVGGLTETDARTALDSALGGLEDGRIELVASGTTGEITYEEVRRTVDRDGMLVQALGHGRGGTRFEEAIAGLQGLLRPTTIPITIGYDRSTLAAKLAAFRMLAERQPVDARARAYHGTFSAVPAADGLAVDTTAVQAKIAQLEAENARLRSAVEKQPAAPPE